MMSPRWIRFAGVVATVIAASACCKSKDPDSHAPVTAPVPPGVSTAAAATTATATAPVAPSIEFFGAPPAEIKFLTYKPLRWNAVQFACPIGWKGADEYYEGLVQLWSKDENSRFTINGNEGPKPGPATIDLWTRNLGGKNVVYGAKTETQLGKKSMPAMMAEGHGLLNKAPARFWSFEVRVGPGQNLLIIAGLKDGAPSERLQELVAAIRSIYKA